MTGITNLPPGGNDYRVPNSFEARKSTENIKTDNKNSMLSDAFKHKLANVTLATGLAEHSFGFVSYLSQMGPKVINTTSEHKANVESAGRLAYDAIKQIQEAFHEIIGKVDK